MSSVLCSGCRGHDLSRWLLGNHIWIFCGSDMNPTYFPSLPPPYHLPILIISISVKSHCVLYLGTLDFYYIPLSACVLLYSSSVPLCSLHLTSILCFSSSQSHPWGGSQNPYQDHYSSLKALVPATPIQKCCPKCMFSHQLPIPWQPYKISFNSYLDEENEAKID